MNNRLIITGEITSIDDAFESASRYYQTGRIKEAEDIYQRILACHPGHPRALHALGVISFRSGKGEEAIDLINQAVTIKPDFADAFNNLGNILKELGRKNEAITAYQQAVAVKPDFAEAHNNLGLIFTELGRREEAAAGFRRAVAARPDFFQAYNHLGDLLTELGSLDEAIATYRKAIEINPDFGVASFSLGNVLALQGKLAEAGDAYRQTLAIMPDFALAHNNLGNVLKEQGKPNEAIASYERALAAAPDLALANNNLGTAYRDQGRTDEAAACYQRALALSPGYAEAYTNLGNVFALQGKLNEAIKYHKKAIALKPELADAYNNLGNAFMARHEPSKAAASYKKALVITPDRAVVHSNLGNALTRTGKPDKAVDSCLAAIELKPDLAEAYNNLGNALKEMGKLNEALVHYEKALEMNPINPQACHNMSIALKEQGKLNEAVTCARRAIAQNPGYAEAYCNLGNILKEQAKLDDAIESLQKALSLQPDHPTAGGNLVFFMNYSPKYTAHDIYLESRLLQKVFEAPHLAHRKAHDNLPDPARRLRIGYVSADFGRHPVGYFLMQVLAAHDSSNVEIFCYSERSKEDDFTIRLRLAADTWHSTVGLTDIALARLIRSDHIDILVDLSGYTAGTRLSVFAMKPAPVQATWAGYVGTTGLSTMDYLISDWLETPEGTDHLYVEKVVRLPDGYICYEPPDYAPPVAPLPMMKRGVVTFGCFNNLDKVNAKVTALWSKLLQELPEARLLLVTKQLNEPEIRERYQQMFLAEGVASRVEFSGSLPHRDLLGRYGDVDIALDPFPYSGGLTTLESLWMGVPVITLGGDRFASRHSLSHLTTVGLPELIADGPEKYLGIAIKLARNPAYLEQLRQSLRPLMAASPLCDGPRFTRNLEAAYRQMWITWCNSIK